MKHLGDITKISGYTAPIVDCIIGGSPCQDLSVAGKRAGLDGERSGLFMEQVRIAKEMRKRDERNGRTGVDIRPRYMVWENVPGAFSSNKGEDFRIVLEELAKVADKDAVIPMPPKDKWTTCGCIVGDGWSIAWRVLDAQFWGVPQRRRRIALVADFGGESAPEILFVRKSLSGHTDESKPKRKETSPDASRGIGADDREGGVPYTLKIRSGVSVDSYGKSAGKGALVQEDMSATLGVSQDQYLFQPIGADLYNTALTGDKASTLGINCGMSHGRNGVLCYDIGEARLRTPSEYDDVSPTLSARCGTGGNNTPAVVTFEPGIASREGGHIYENVCGTLRANAGDNQMATAYVFSKSKRAQSESDYESWKESDTANTLNGFDTGDVRTSEAVVYALDRASFNQGKNAQYDFEVSDKGVNPPIVAKGPSAVCYPTVGDGVVGTLDAHYSNFPGMRGGMERTMVAQAVDTSHADDVVRIDDVVSPLQARDYKGGKLVAQAVDARNGTESDVNGSLQSNSAHSLNGNNVVRLRYIVRRLTPKECERLQGYPDGWSDIGEWTDSNGKKRQTSDSNRYKALGNSIALPPWRWLLKRLCACYERDATMASLFDGIGGFPLLWEQINGKGSCLWASEIEEFPIAVTKVRIGGD